MMAELNIIMVETVMVKQKNTPQSQSHVDR